MEESMSLEDFRRWKVPQLRDFLRKRGLAHSSKRKDELVALAFAAYKDNRPVIASVVEASKTKADDYQQILSTKEGVRFADPNDLAEGWLPERLGVEHWPPTMHMDIAVYLLTHVKDKNLSRRLMGDYKEGKAFSYFEAKWLKEIFYHEVGPNSTVCFLKAESTPSERLGAIPHKLWVAIEKKTGSIESAYCTCFAGLGSTCNHVAALLFKLEYAWQQGWTNKSCTSRPCEWNKYGSSRHILETKEISEMEWRKPHRSKKGKKTVINPGKRQLFSPKKKSTSQPVQSLERIISYLYSSCPQACAFQYAHVLPGELYPAEADINVSECIEIVTEKQVPPSLPTVAQGSSSVTHFMCNLPILTEEEISITEKETRLQSACTQWKEQRLGRVTGSIAHRVMTRVNTITSAPDKFHDLTSLLSQIMGYTTPPEHIPALKYGRSMEGEARQCYKASMMSSGHVQFTVQECGLFIDMENVFIAATPDGVVHCECCGDGLLEIKCPLSIAHENPCSVNLGYLESHDGKFSLRKSHPYYSQVQLQLGVTKKLWCDFFVYTRHGHLTTRVEFDRERWVHLVAAADYMFKNYIANELITSTLKQELDKTAQVANEQAVSATCISVSSTPSITTASAYVAEAEPSTSQIVPLTTSEISAESGALAKSSTRSNIQSTTTSRKKKGKRRKHSFSPLYSCNLCGNLCKELPDLSTESDNSVQCDNVDCGLWYHWSCVGFQDSDENWFCPFCAEINQE